MYIKTLMSLDNLISNTAVDPFDYKDLFPLFVFDVSKQSERLKLEVFDVTVEMMFGTNVPENPLFRH